ncbi:MAG: helix-turn-helix domain-containing protein [Betaproteobacteria bacterium]|nr:helix-turn-helix domain-containing protein [Betaproteobacteria bacterium]
MDATQTLIDRARAYLDARRGERTTLEELGRAVGASPFHLQRSFKRVLGLSPRDYQQALRLEDAKRALAGGRRVTDAVFEAGYGSLSRFYEKAAAGLGMAAKAYRAKGKGQSIAYITFHSPLGCILLASSPSCPATRRWQNCRSTSAAPSSSNACGRPCGRSRAAKPAPTRTSRPRSVRPRPFEPWAAPAAQTPWRW